MLFKVHTRYEWLQWYNEIVTAESPFGGPHGKSVNTKCDISPTTKLIITSTNMRCCCITISVGLNIMKWNKIWFFVCVCVSVHGSNQMKVSTQRSNERFISTYSPSIRMPCNKHLQFDTVSSYSCFHNCNCNWITEIYYESNERNFHKIEY